MPSAVEIGHRFTKAGDQFGKVWEVSRVWTASDGILHAELKGIEHQSETMTVSASTLTDRQFFVPVPTPSTGQ